MQRGSGLTRVLQRLGPDFRATLVLAGPVVIAELGWVVMGIVDTMMVGPLGAEAIGAVSVGSALHFTVALFGMGLLLGLDTLVSQAFGEGKLEDCHRALFSGIYLSLVFTLLLTALVRLSIPYLYSWGIHPTVLGQAIPYLQAVTWSTLPLLLYAAFRRYLQAMNLVKPVMSALVTANLIHVAANWILIFGHLGVPAMGVEGAGWATCISRVYLCLYLVGYTYCHDRRLKTGLLRIPFTPETARIRLLVRLGFPAALQVTLEVGVFAVATALAGRLDPASLAAHQIVLNVTSFTFMVPLGIASAAAVRVGQALGQRAPARAGRVGWTALLLGAGCMACVGLAFLLLPQAIVGLFTTETTVVSTGVSLLIITALFQWCDGLQAVATGILRGTGDTRTPMICTLVSYWFLGLPVGYTLCFFWSWSIFGLWIGLSVSSVAAGLVLLYVWSLRVGTLNRGDASESGWSASCRSESVGRESMIKP